MTGTVAATGVLPDPPYLLIPFFGVIGGLFWSAAKWLTEYEPDLPHAWAVGNIVGAALGALLLPIFLVLGVH